MRRRTVWLTHVAVPFLVALSGILAQPAPARVAAEEPKPAVAPDQAQKPAAPAPDPAARRHLKNNEFLLALSLWVGVLVIGLSLLAMIVSWGRSVRNLARGKPRPPTAPDPLWYLKPKPAAPAASASTESGPDNGEPGSDASTGTPL
jgi:hypothetical protein